MKSLSLAFYRLGCRLFQLVVLLTLPFLLLTFGGDANELRQRLGWLTVDNRNRKRRLIWIHAASVGEVKAAAILIEQLNGGKNKLDFLVSTVTRQGQKIAQSMLPLETNTTFAPIDLPECVSLALRRVKPSLYICLETELWPNILIQAQKNGCPVIILNARMSAKSAHRYQRFRWIAAPLLKSITAIGAITEIDRQRYLFLGAEKKTTRTCGNLKYDQTVGPEANERTLRYRKQLRPSMENKVLVAGSTHAGEERMLLEQYRQMRHDIPGLILILAPRHLERLEDVEKELCERELAFTRLSRLNKINQHGWTNFGASATTKDENSPNPRHFVGDFRIKEKPAIILVDTMGDLAALYGLADWVFCGGSLVDRGGHNIMEAAIHAVPVFYGPSMKDFADATAVLEDCGGSIMIKSAAELRQIITRMTPGSDQYRKTAAAAGKAARNQTGAAARQAAIAIAALEKNGLNR